MNNNRDAIEEFDQLIREATQTVEDELKIEDRGWTNFSATTGDIISQAARIDNLKLSRLYYTKDPLARQAIRLWTDYTFGQGMTFRAEEDKTQEVLKAFWDASVNTAVLSARGQRKSSDKLLVDGDIFFALFPGAGGAVTIRWIDPLEIVEFITNPQDGEDVRYYKRSWTDNQNKSHDDYYRSFGNKKDVATLDAAGASRVKTNDALVYHLAGNTISQRGNPLLLPALDWIKQYRRFLASRVAIMLALARVAWRNKIKGGTTSAADIQAVYNEKEVAAGSVIIENMGADMQPIKTDSGARNAYNDARLLKLQIAAAVGIPEQYFGDISIGNLATAKTVELPMMKMFQSYQQVWADAYKEINEFVLEHNGVKETLWYVDMDFPAIAPEDVAQMALSIAEIIKVMPKFASSPDVQQAALLSLGINNPSEVLDAMAEEEEKTGTEPPEEVEGNETTKLVRALQNYREKLREKE